MSLPADLFHINYNFSNILELLALPVYISIQVVLEIDTIKNNCVGVTSKVSSYE